jgi:hypothetical protein
MFTRSAIYATRYVKQRKTRNEQMTNAQIEKMVEARNADMAAESAARGDYFAATMKRAENIGSGSATQAEYEAMMTLRTEWKKQAAV